MMNKWMKIWTTLVILCCNGLLQSVKGDCVNLYADFAENLPQLTKVMLWGLEHHFYLLFSIVSILILWILPKLYQREMNLEVIVLGIHLLLISGIFFAFILPFISMCEKIN